VICTLVSLDHDQDVSGKQFQSRSNSLEMWGLIVLLWTDLSIIILMLSHIFKTTIALDAEKVADLGYLIDVTCEVKSSRCERVLKPASSLLTSRGRLLRLQK